MTAPTPEVPAKYRLAARATNSVRPLSVVALALYRYTEESWVPLSAIGHEAGVDIKTIYRWATAAGLPLREQRPLRPSPEDAREAIAAIERYGSETAAAKALGIFRKTLRYRAEAGGYVPPDRRETISAQMLDRYAVEREGFLSSREAAATIGKTRSWLNEMCRTGRVPGARLMPGPRGTRLLWHVPTAWVTANAETDRPATPSGRQVFLSARPLSEWLALQAYELHELSRKAGVPERRIYGLRKALSRYVELGVADRLTAAFDCRLDDVWIDADADLAESTRTFYADRARDLARANAVKAERREREQGRVAA